MAGREVGARPPAAEPSSLRDWAAGCGLAGAGLGAFAFAGWPSMSAPSALMALLCGAALAGLSRPGLSARACRSCRWLAAATCALGAATLAADAFGLRSPAIELLSRWMPARPSPYAAAAFLYLGAALLMEDLQGLPRRLVPYLALAAGSLASAALLGHLFELRPLEDVPLFLPHAGMTGGAGAAVLVLSAGALLSRPERGVVAMLADGSAGAHVARRLLAGAAALAPLVFLLAFGLRRGAFAATAGLSVFVFLALAERVAAAVLAAERINSLEAARGREEARYRELVAQASDGIFIADLDGRYTDVNDAGCRMLGCSREEIIGKSIADLIPPEDLPRLRSHKERLLSGEIEVSEWTLRRKDGVRLPVEVSARIFPDGRWQGFVRDITERKRIQRFKDEIIAMTSHELQNPLSTVHLAVRMVLSGDTGPISEKASELLGAAQNATRTMIRLIADFLDLERLEAGTIRFEKELLEVGPLLEKAASAVKAAGAGGRVTVKPGASGLAIKSDSARLTQVAVNLLSNALKFSPPGAPVEMWAERRGKCVRVCVRDRGPGIAEEFRGRIFQRFARAAEATAPGSGLGLSIAKRIVDGLGGRIGYHTELGKGTTFYFELPAAQAAGSVSRR